MIILGLTGSIGMGKSTASAMLRDMGVPVHDSDQAVHTLLAEGGRAVAPVLKLFPHAGHVHGGVDRTILGRSVFADEAARRDLESVIHPLVVESQGHFLQRARRRRVPLAALDIPLLFETGADARVDYTLVVTAPPFVQRARVLARGLSAQQFEKRLAAQIPDVEKRARADFVVQTGLGLSYTRKSLERIRHYLIHA